MAKIAIDMKSGSIKSSENKSTVIVGIDLGTTNSLVAYYIDGEPKAIKDKAGKHALVPSIVHFSADGTPIVGNDAKPYLLTDPSNTIYSVKRLMGRSYKDVATQENYFGYRIIDEESASLVKIGVRDKYFTPIELSAEILKTLKARIEHELGQTVEKAVITVPAYFNDSQRQATRAAGKLAGLDVLRIVNEPTAAALAYGIGLKKDEDQVVAVYDLGGGTFDISILDIQQGVFEVLSTNGDTYLGGDDIDRAIVNYWVEAHSLQNGTDQALRLLAEEAKKHLSSNDTFSSSFEGKTVSLSVEQFNSLVEPIFTKTLDKVKAALKDSKLDKSQIDQIILVGGSTRTPYIEQQLAAFFEKPIHNKLNPDEVVALGAAVQADILAGNNKDILLLDITPLSLGIETVGGLMDVILPRNSKVPSRVGRQYTTSIDGQTNLKVAVYQGERDLVQDNRKLGEFILSNIPPMPAGLPKIEIQFILDADGILQVKAKELRSEVEQTITIQSQYGITEEEMAKMLIDSIQNAEKDVAVKGLIEARNEGNNIVLSAKKFIKQHEAILSEAEINQTKELTTALEQTIAGEDKDAINKAMEVLNEFTKPLAHRALDSAISEAMAGKKL